MTLTLDREQARRLAVLGQLLGGRAPDGIPVVVERLGAVQRDPTAAVAPTEYIVLWSRLGDYDRADLDRLLYEEQELADYWVHIVPVAGTRVSSVREWSGIRTATAHARVTAREWLAAQRLVPAPCPRGAAAPGTAPVARPRGPRGRAISRRAAATTARTSRGCSTRCGSRAGSRSWGVRVASVSGTSRSEPGSRSSALAGPELARRLVDQQLKANGIATADALGRAFDGVRARGSDRALSALAAEGIARPVAIEALPGDWYAHRDVCRAAWDLA